MIGMIAPLLLASSTVVSEPSAQLLHSQTFPEPVRREVPKYPRTYMKKGISYGWVKVSFVVDEHGDVTDPVILDSTGQPLFEKAATRALKQWKYSPAMVDGKPVKQCNNKVMLTFEMAKAQGAKRKMFRTLKIAEKHIEEGRYQDAIELLRGNESEISSSYEFAFLGYSLANAYRKLDDQAGLLKALTMASETIEDNDGSPRFVIGNDSGFVITYELFGKYVNSGLYAHARDLLRSKAQVEGFNNNELMQKAQNVIAQIENFDGPVTAQLSLGERGVVSHQLVRNEFAFVALDGQIDKLQVRCSLAMHEFSFALDSQWQIPQGWGDCSVLLTGQPGTEVTMVELNSQVGAQAQAGR